MQLKPRLLLLVFLVGQITIGQESSKDPLTITIKAREERNHVGSPISIQVTITNTSNRRLYFTNDDPNSVSGYRPQVTLDVRDGDGQQATLSDLGKRMRARKGNLGNPISDPMVPGKPIPTPKRAVGILEPGRSFTEELDLHREFLLKPGTYVVRAERADQLSGRIVASNSLTLTIAR